jgi:Ni,Fe-hydrogenase III large subunit
MLRVGELKQSAELIFRLVKRLSAGPVITACEPKNGFGLSAVESWRGEVMYAVFIKDGVIERIAPRDPSFCNWALFGIIGPGNIVPDFPLCNKSLDLSYSGTDM